MIATNEQLINFKRLVERLLDESQGEALLPNLGAKGTCLMLAEYPEGRITTAHGPLSYKIANILLPHIWYLGPHGVWNDARYEYLWLIAELSDKEWLELFEDA